MAAITIFSSASVVRAESVTIATTGGTYEKVLRDAWFEPFTKVTGIEVVTVSATDAEKRAKASAMVRTGNVTWDLFLDGEIQTGSQAHFDVAEDLTEFCKSFATSADLVFDACTRGGVRLQSTATLLVFKPSGDGNHPKNWADMWDTKRFPGGRAFPNFDDPWRVMAAALLADGVNKDALFPLDIERALRKLDEIRPAVELWWKTGDQSVQGFRNGDYNLGQIWLTRAKALQNEGFDIGWSYDGAFLVGDRIALIKGAKNRENALKLVTFWLDNPDVQAKACEQLSCTPPSRKSIAMMSAAGRAGLPSAADVESRIIVPDADWINSNMAMLIQRWNEWIR
ncbi:extracellular solute-binding protein [Agrobacterium sp. V1]|uniref:extracellular solute-binding protein n=1 Tax=Agrobacterium sp. V1 TaxID=3061957 RepID=UPI0026741E09|nr:extracellular solute-binding protein [Agrobacterium sp. V1]MDO3445478.1 extracellular solute-binding protein [Agrobacterium sp. V1]